MMMENNVRRFDTHEVFFLDGSYRGISLKYLGNIFSPFAYRQTAADRVM